MTSGRKLFANDDPFLFQMVQTELERLGIPHFVKNQFASGAIGELAPLDTVQEVWLTDDAWLDRAKRLVDELVAQGEEQTHQEEWQCAECNEMNDGVFVICWSCQASKPNSQ